VSTPSKYQQHFPIATGAWNASNPLAANIDTYGLNLPILTDEFSGGLPYHRATSTVQATNYPQGTNTADPTYADTPWGTKTGLLFAKASSAGLSFTGRNISPLTGTGGVAGTAKYAVQMAALVNFTSLTASVGQMAVSIASRSAGAGNAGDDNSPALGAYGTSLALIHRNTVRVIFSGLTLQTGRWYALAMSCWNSTGTTYSTTGTDLMTEAYAYDFTSGTVYGPLLSAAAGTNLGFSTVNDAPVNKPIVVAPINTAIPTWIPDLTLAHVLAAYNVRWDAATFAAYYGDAIQAMRPSAFSISEVVVPLSATTDMHLSGVVSGYPNAVWTPGTPGSPTFGVASSGGASATKNSQVVTSATAATVNVTATSATGTATFTDPVSFFSVDAPVQANAVTGITISGSTSPVAGYPNTYTLGVTPVGGTISGGTLSVTVTDPIDGTIGTVNLTTGSPTATVSFTPSTARTNTLTAASSGLTSGTLNYTSAYSSLSPGTIVVASETQNTTALTGTVTVKGDGTSGSGLASGGHPAISYSWYQSADAVTFNLLAGQTGQNLTLTNQPYGALSFVKRRATDAGSTTADTPRVAFSTTPPQNLMILLIGDSRMQNLGVGTGSIEPLLPPLLTDSQSDVWGTVTCLNRGYSGSQAQGTAASPWYPTASGTLLPAAVTAADAAAPANCVKIALVDLGVNDAANGTDKTVAGFVANIQAIAAYLVSAGYIVGLCKPPVGPGASTPVLSLTTQFGDALTQATNGTTIFLAEHNNRRMIWNNEPAWDADEIHPSSLAFPAMRKNYADAAYFTYRCWRDGLGAATPTTTKSGQRRRGR
jgi:hypothetical protein